MGIANPRPAMRRGEERRIREMLSRHATLIREYIQQGKTVEEASKLALQDMRKL